MPRHDQQRSLPLTGRHAVVTGASGGIGEAVCHPLARQGATLTLLGRREPELEKTCERLPGKGHGVAVADVANHETVGRVMKDSFAARGPVQILVNNAGIAKSAALSHRTRNPDQDDR